jgi:hypothetical protein
VDPGDRGGRAGVIRQSTKYGQFISLLNEDKFWFEDWFED